MRLEIRPISLPQDTETLLAVQDQIYADQPHWVSPLRFERKAFFDPNKNPFFKHAEVACFLAVRDGTAVGSIAACVDQHQQDVEPGLGFFGFFEFINDRTVALTLLKRAMDWLHSKGMEEARGPYNFSLNHEAGLLVEGFDSDPVVLTTYNPSYYAEIYEQIGLEPVQDLYGWWLEDAQPPERLSRIAQRLSDRHPDFVTRPLNLADFANEIERARLLFNDSWSQNWGYTKIGKEEFHALAHGLKPMLHPRLSWFVEHEGEPIAMAICLLDYNQAVKPMKGRLWPVGWFHWLRRRSKLNQARVFLLGVRHSHQHMPLGAALYTRIWEEAGKLGLRGAEASWVLESNHRMNSALEKLGARRYKTWRLYNVLLKQPTHF